ncbi:hypothetical protein B5F39_00395 [Cloacibacillus sp. An23]|nr:hypothetical protein B5F39_00395 [Cloacibacillus sp. An23]
MVDRRRRRTSSRNIEKSASFKYDISCGAGAAPRGTTADDPASDMTSAPRASFRALTRHLIKSGLSGAGVKASDAEAGRANISNKNTKYLFIQNFRANKSRTLYTTRYCAPRPHPPDVIKNAVLQKYGARETT